MSKIRVTVWHENMHEKTDPRVLALYPNGIHGTIKGFLDENEDMEVRACTLDDPDQGLSDEILDNTDVLIWWGHMGHALVNDDRVQKVYDRVQDGMGLIALHSAHGSKIFAKLLGTRAWGITWRESDDRSLVWVVEPNHPIAAGLGRYIELEKEEMYGEPLQFPRPDEIVFISWFEGGEVMRSGLTYFRGNGRIFYFQPGHETYPSYNNPDVRKVITNAVRWANAGTKPQQPLNCPPPVAPIAPKN